jgi:RHH-type proline utilization regulon transcriptional repressor/proline dehydrogenase/delta 1-pyrroline-5-carboxylate dehydrogenase
MKATMGGKPMLILPAAANCAGRLALRHACLAPEARLLAALRPTLQGDWRAIERHAQTLLIQMEQAPTSLRELLLQLFPLTSAEGQALTRLAEAALRIPDSATLDQLLHDLLQQGDWQGCAQRAADWPGSLAAQGLWLGQKLEQLASAGSFGEWLNSLGHASLRQLARKAVSELSADFVLGENIEQALANSQAASRYRYSFDMLGEAALSYADAEGYFQAYRHAILSVGQCQRDDPADRSVSIKLSALHPRYEWRNKLRVWAEMLPLLRALAELARQYQVPLTLDAEEAERLELSLDLFQALFLSPELQGWSGLGLALQAYSRRASAQIDWLAQLARQTGKSIPLRLVKGAYWDSEIKRAQQFGQSSYPVFTRKSATDLSYLACARQLLDYGDLFQPQFATHNVFSAAYVLQQAQQRGRKVEFQRLFGMGEALHQQLLAQGMASRVYAPVGELRRLLPYLVRRLLENGANNSFVKQLRSGELAPDTLPRLLQAPLTPGLPEPSQIFSPRINAAGGHMADIDYLQTLQRQMTGYAGQRWLAQPLVAGVERAGTPHACYSPLDAGLLLGQVVEAGVDDVAAAYVAAQSAQPDWAALPASQRAQRLLQLADLLQQQQAELLALLLLEGGKALPDAVAELREAIDYCRWYAQQACRQFAEPQALEGVVGESNLLYWRGRGVLVCISPWNFPLAIFVGQMTAALVAGNAVLAKPSRATCLIAARVVELAHQAGIPPDVLHLLPGSGAGLSDALLQHPALAGVVFTGSAEVAKHIQRQLAARDGAIVPLIAETSGLNAMIADSSAHLEQLVQDALTSAFNSAGQRCSALRVLCLQDEIADQVIEMLRAALMTWQVGDVRDIANDIGPLISASALQQLSGYAAELRGTWRAQLPLPDDLPPGHYFAPRIIEISRDDWPRQEAFGPILQIVRWPQGSLSELLDFINQTGYGLTLALHSRLPSHVALLQQKARAGNLYVNRNQIGAVVGSQPFGGEGRSGTGPKAGGPHYLQRFAVERVISINTAAIGGTPELFKDA